jgi:MFS family permease
VWWKKAEKPDVSVRIKTVFRSLKYRNYRLFFSGQSISLIGTWMQRIAMPWLVYHITGSAFMLGLVSFGGQIPTFILAPVAGVLTDKFDKYKVLVITQIVFFFQALILAILALTGAIQVWHIVVLSIALGCINAFDVPSRQSFVVEMVENKEDLGNAIALNSMMFNGARIIGPSIAGLILATAGEGICFLINAISFVFVIASLLMMRVKPATRKPDQGNLLNDLKEGMSYVNGFAPIKHLLILLSVISLMGASYQVIMPVFAKEVLKGGSSTFGFLMGSAGLGALLGALYLASRETVIKLGRLIPAAAALFGISLVMLSFTKFLPFSLILMVFTGLGMMMNTAACNTVLQTITEDDKRGRVMSFYTMAIMGTAPFGSLLVGSLARFVGTQNAIFVSGISSVIGAFFFYKKLPELKRIIRPVYVKMGLIPEVVSAIQTASEPSVKKTDLTTTPSGRQTDQGI